MSTTRQRALEVLARAGFSQGAEAILAALAEQGLHLADERRQELVCRWVNVIERAVPPEADTIIRTLTRTTGEQSFSSTYWLDGLRAPPSP